MTRITSALALTLLAALAGSATARAQSLTQPDLAPWPAGIVLLERHQGQGTYACVERGVSGLRDAVTAARPGLRLRPITTAAEAIDCQTVAGRDRLVADVVIGAPVPWRIVRDTRPASAAPQDMRLAVPPTTYPVLPAPRSGITWR